MDETKTAGQNDTVDAADRAVQEALRRQTLERLAHRCERLAKVCRLDGIQPPDVVVGLFVEHIIDAALAYSTDAVVKALVDRLARNARLTHGVCFNCGVRPSAGSYMCDVCMREEREAEQIAIQTADLATRVKGSAS